MRLIATEDGEYKVDLITAAVDVGRVAALASKVEWVAVVEPGENGSHVRLWRAIDKFGEQELTDLAMLWAYVSGKSGEETLTRFRQNLERRHVPIDRPVQDVMEIGGVLSTLVTTDPCEMADHGA